MQVKTIALALSTAFILSACGNTAPKEEKTADQAPVQETKVEEVKEEPKKEEVKKEEPKKEENKDPYTISDVNVVEENSMYYVEGILKNDTDEDKSYVQIQYPAKDADGNKIGDALANVNNLKAGDTWKFKAMLFQKADGEVTFDLENPKIKGF